MNVIVTSSKSSVNDTPMMSSHVIGAFRIVVSSAEGWSLLTAERLGCKWGMVDSMEVRTYKMFSARSLNVKIWGAKVL